MVGEFRAVLRDPDAGFGIRSVVVDALWLGTPLPEMIPDLVEIFMREASPYAERLQSALALLHLGDDGRSAVIDAYRAGLGKTVNGLRLRTEIIQHLYGESFGITDVIAVVNDTLEADGTLTTGMFWALADYVRPADLPAALDAIHPPRREGDAGRLDRF